MAGVSSATKEPAAPAAAAATPADAPVEAKPSKPATEQATDKPAEEQPTEQPTEPNPVAVAPETQVEAEEESVPFIIAADFEDDGDSACGTDNESSTASLSSSIFNYRNINGRFYHAERSNGGDGNYWGATDARSMDAAEMWNLANTLLLGKQLFKAPLEAASLHHALDVGTGTGRWAMEFADEFPNCEVIGTDLSPIQESWVPPNLRFEIEDCTQDWTFADNKFDYVHIRLLYGSIHDWKHIFNEAYRVLKPGGWIESHEASPYMTSYDDTIKEGMALHEWGELFVEGGKKLGRKIDGRDRDRTFEVIQKDLQLRNVRRLGMVDIKHIDIPTPIGGWPKDPDQKAIGQVLQASLLEDLAGFANYVCQAVHGWEEREVEMFCHRVRDEIRNPKTHPWFMNRVVWARKPFAPA